MLVNAITITNRLVNLARAGHDDSRILLAAVSARENREKLNFNT